MPNIEMQLPAGIGEPVVFAGPHALVVAWRLVRPLFLAGGSFDRAPQLSLPVITEDGQDLWLREVEVTSLSSPALVSIFLPFAGGDQVLVGPSGARGEVRGWEDIGQRLGVELVYRLHLAGTPSGEELEVRAQNLELRT